VYEYWRDRADVSVGESDTMAENIELKAARFASVEVRPDQAAFRRKVFLKYGGRCAISGCTIETALDAAHKPGRTWRDGHNLAEDGLLLRKDLHALYDNGLLKIDQDGSLTFDPVAAEHYADFPAVKIALV
jgi:hypothetical protein